MDLILLILAVAVAMLVSNVRAARNKRRDDDAETSSATESGVDETLADLLRQLTGNRSAETIGTDEDPESIDSCTKKGRTDQPEYGCGHASEITPMTSCGNQITASHSLSQHIGPELPDNTVVGDAAGTHAPQTEEECVPAEEFDLRQAVLYSEILKPKFDNFKD